jgi:hypothetical protein
VTAVHRRPGIFSARSARIKKEKANQKGKRAPRIARRSFNCLKAAFSIAAELCRSAVAIQPHLPRIARR